MSNDRDNATINHKKGIDDFAARNSVQNYHSDMNQQFGNAYKDNYQHMMMYNYNLHMLNNPEFYSGPILVDSVKPTEESRKKIEEIIESTT